MNAGARRRMWLGLHRLWRYNRPISSHLPPPPQAKLMLPNFQQHLQAYAEVIVKIGLNLRSGQRLVITALRATFTQAGKRAALGVLPVWDSMCIINS